jgi:hypothetical protein
MTDRQALARGAMTVQTLNCLGVLGALIGAAVGVIAGAYIGYGLNPLGQFALAAVLFIVGMVVGSRIALMLATR